MKKITKDLFNEALNRREAGEAVRGIARSLDVNYSSLRFKLEKHDRGNPIKNGFKISSDKDCIITCHIKGGSIDDATFEHLAETNVPVYIFEVNLGSKVNEVDQFALDVLPENVYVISSRECSLGKVDILNLSGARQTMSHLLDSNRTAIYPRPNFDVRAAANGALEDTHHVIATGTITSSKNLYKPSHAAYMDKLKHSEGYLYYDSKNKAFYHKDFNDYANSHSILGDLHIPTVNPSFFDSMKNLKEQGVKSFVFHDFIDFGEISHHHYGNLNRKQFTDSDYSTTVIKMVNMILDIAGDSEVYVVGSNHDSHFTSGILAQNPKNLSDEEKKLYFQLGKSLYDYPDKNDIYRFLASSGMDIEKLNKIKFISAEDEFKIGGWDLSKHGHKGINGAKFGNTTVAKLNNKMIKAHDHTAFREGNVLSVGTNSNMNMGYNLGGLGSWSQVNAIIYTNEDGQAHATLVIPSCT
jgi:hypothetical protein